jgi:hypothetical protein
VNDGLSTVERELGIVNKATRELEQKVGGLQNFQDETIAKDSQFEKADPTQKALSTRKGGHYTPFSIAEATNLPST